MNQAKNKVNAIKCLETFKQGIVDEDNSPFGVKMLYQQVNKGIFYEKLTKINFLKAFKKSILDFHTDFFKLKVEPIMMIYLTGYSTKKGELCFSDDNVSYDEIFEEIFV